MSPDIDVKSDLLLALMNLIEAETHARFSWYATKKEEWLIRLNHKREMRASIMHELEKEEDSQLHCYNKHILSACFRFWEVGDKYLSENNNSRAILFYDKGFELLEEFVATNILNQEETKSFLEKIKKEVFIMIPIRRSPPQRPPQKPKEESEDCEMEFKRTRSGGVKVRVSKHCTPQQIKMIQETRGVKPEDIIRDGE